jgi:photosystem II stability/assembly factor-like uncharacterized protein
MKKIFYLPLFLFFIFPSAAIAQWFLQESGTTESLYSVQFSDPNNGWMVNYLASKLFHTTNGGTDWFLQYDFGVSVIWNFIIINDSIGYINYHGSPEQLYKTTDGGWTWQSI